MKVNVPARISSKSSELSWDEMVAVAGVYKHSSANYHSYRFIVLESKDAGALVYERVSDMLYFHSHKDSGWSRKSNNHSFVKVEGAAVNFSINE